MGYTPPHLDVQKVAGGWSVKPPGDTTDDLFLYANRTDARARMILYGNNGVYVDLGSGTYYTIADAGTGFLGFYRSTDAIIETLVADQHLYLKPNGTGKLKFGTHTGSGDVACNGSIAILDAAGNARKLMTTA